MPQKHIFTGFAPNIDRRDVATSIKLLFQPWRWKTGKAQNNAQKWLQEYFAVEDVYLIDSGRSALSVALEALGVTKDDEVLVQAFTCTVVINAITRLGAKPIYVDIQSDYNIDPEDLKRKITSRAKALIIQHTFGNPADMDALLHIAKEYELATVEDCAHALGSKFDGKKLGTFADIGIFSFGSDKVISCVRGGALVVNTKEVAPKVKEIISSLPTLSLFQIKKHLIHAPLFYFGKKWYGIGIGKVLLYVQKKLQLVPRTVSEQEKRGEVPNIFPAQFSNALAILLLGQLHQLKTLLQHRKDIAKVYDSFFSEETAPLRSCSECTYLRYPLQVSNKNDVLLEAKKRNVLLGDWYSDVVTPVQGSLKDMWYTSGSCPTAETISKTVVNLPTNRHISEKDAIRIATLVKEIT